MEGSIERVRAVVNGKTPDRAPLFDLLRNDAAISAFAGETLTVENAPQVVFQAYEPAIDATRPGVRLPGREETSTLPDGRKVHDYRWTTWVAPRVYRDSEAYAAEKRRHLGSTDPTAWSEQNERWLASSLAGVVETRRRLGEVFLMPVIGGPGLMGIFGEVGVEAFCHYWLDYPDIIAELLEHNTAAAITSAEHHPADHGIEAGFLGDDIAFNGGPLLNIAWMREHYFPRLARITRAWHDKGLRVLFHSDGNLNPILDDLVEAGIDGLNPIEVLAGMDVSDIHRRHPHLFLAGGIDVSQLLPLGTAQEVRDATRRALDEAEGRILVGSSTELNNDVPLENFLAMRETVLEYRYL